MSDDNASPYASGGTGSDSHPLNVPGLPLASIQVQAFTKLLARQMAHSNPIDPCAATVLYSGFPNTPTFAPTAG